MKGNRFLASLAAALVHVGCTQADAAESGIPLADARTAPGEVFPARLSEIRTDCSFPAVQNPPLLDEFSREWYSRHLVAAGEPSLVSIAEAAPVGGMHLRFTWLRSFHPPVVVRVSAMSPGEMEMTAKLLSGAGGYEPGKIAQQVDRTLDPAETRQLQALLESSQLLEEPAETCELGLDGAQWIVEVVEGDSYYFFDRWTPDEGAVRELGLLMLGLTGWPTKSDEIY